MTVTNPSLHRNAKRTLLTPPKPEAIAAELLEQVRPSLNIAK